MKLKTNWLFLIITLFLSISCNKNNEWKKSQECVMMEKDIKKLQESFYLNCLNSCFRTTLSFSSSISNENKEKVKNACNQGCKNGAPNDVVNNIKRYLDGSYDCRFNYDVKP